jgi:hypothetical protein
LSASGGEPWSLKRINESEKNRVEEGVCGEDLLEA